METSPTEQAEPELLVLQLEHADQVLPVNSSREAETGTLAIVYGTEPATGEVPKESKPDPAAPAAKADHPPIEAQPVHVGAAGRDEPPGAVADTPSLSRVLKHSTKTKPRNLLDPVIELAQKECTDPKDTAQVLARLQVLAESEHPPLLASTPNGLKYTRSGRDAYLKRDALDKRLHPEKRKPRRQTPQGAA